MEGKEYWPGQMGGGWLWAQCVGVAVGPDEEGGLREKEDWRSQEAQSVLAHNV